MIAQNAKDADNKLKPVHHVESLQTTLGPDHFNIEIAYQGERVFDPRLCVRQDNRRRRNHGPATDASARPRPALQPPHERRAARQQESRRPFRASARRPRTHGACQSSLEGARPCAAVLALSCRSACGADRHESSTGGDGCGPIPSWISVRSMSGSSGRMARVIGIPTSRNGARVVTLATCGSTSGPWVLALARSR